MFTKKLAEHFNANIAIGTGLSLSLFFFGRTAFFTFTIY